MLEIAVPAENIQIQNLSLVDGAGQLRARFDLCITLSPQANTILAGSGDLRAYRCGFYVKPDKTAFVQLPTFNKNQNKNGADGNPMEASYVKSGTLPRHLVPVITSEVQKKLASLAASAEMPA